MSGLDVDGGVRVGPVFKDVDEVTYHEAPRAPAPEDEKLRFESLLGNHRLFAGREFALDRLNRFADKGGGYLLVTAPSGYGKTALLANWVTDLKDAKRPLAYAFVNRLAGHAGEEGTFRALCQQLGAVHGETGGLPTGIADLHLLFLRLLGAPHGGEKPVVIIVDGLDEAQWELQTSLFATKLPSTVAVVYSARDIAEQDWVEDLGLRERPVETLRLSTLSIEEIGEIISAAGDAIPEWARSHEALERIYERSGGDPLYVRYLVSDLVPSESREARIASLQDLERQPSGLDGYFDKWWEQIEEARSGSTELGPAVRDFLGYLLVAKGPLSREELSEASEGDALDDWNVDEVRAALGRFVLGDGESGFTLGHPRFQSYLARRRLKKPVQRPYREHLLAYCARWREHESPYALRHYADHLAEIGAEKELQALARDDEFAAAQHRLLPSEPRQPVRVCELALSSAAAKDDAALMGEFAFWKARRLAAARTARSPLAGLREIDLAAAWALADLHDAELRGLWHLLLAWELKDLGRREEARRTLQRLEEQQLGEIPLRQVSEIFAAVSDLDVDLIVALQQRLIPKYESMDYARAFARAGQVDAALELIRGVQDSSMRESAAGEVARALSESGQVDAALELAETITDEGTRDWALSSIAEAQVPRADGSGARRVADATRGFWRASALTAAAKAHARAGQIDAALRDAEEIEDAPARIAALIGIAEEQLQRGDEAGVSAVHAAAVDLAETIEEPGARADAVASIAESMALVSGAGARELLVTALEAVEALDDDADRSRALIAIGRAQARAGDEAGARATLAEGARTARSAAEPGRDWLLSSAADAQCIAGDTTAALESARQISEDLPRRSALTTIAKAMADAGDTSLALELVAGIKDQYSRDTAVDQLATARLDAGDVDAAIALANEIHDDFPRETTLRALAVRQADSGDATGALKTVQEISSEPSRTSALTAVAETQARTGDVSGARETYAAALMSMHGGEEERLRANVLGVVSEAQARAGDLPGAVDTARALSEPLSRVGVLTGIAGLQTEQGDFAAARETCVLARESLDEITDELARVWALTALGRAQAMAQDEEGAAATFQAALDLGKGASNEWVQSNTFVSVAGAIAETGDTAGALEVARQVPDPSSRVRAITSIARARVDQDGADVAEIYDEAQQEAQAIEEETWRPEALVTISESRAATGDATAALEVARSISDDPSRARALIGIAAAQAEAGDVTAARATCVAARDAALGDRSTSGTLVLIAELQAQTGAVSDALETLESISEERWRPVVLAAIAEHQAAAGDDAGARETFSRAFETAASIHQVGDRREAVGEILRRQVRSGFAKEAVATLGTSPIPSAYLGDIAAQLAEIDHKGCLKVALEACTEHADLTGVVLMCLVTAYPEQATPLAERIVPLVA